MPLWINSYSGSHKRVLVTHCLCSCPAPGPVLRPGDAAVTKTGAIPSPQVVH